MPTTERTYTTEDVNRWAGDPATASAGRSVQKKFTTLGISADGTWLLGQCQGSGKEPYQVSVDLGDPDAPTFRCNCPSRKFPCKHGIGLMLCWIADSKKFKPQEPAADLLAKREKKSERERKKADTLASTPVGEEAAGDPASSGPAKKAASNAAQKKKIAAQREGLELLEKLIIDLASSGQWFEATRLEKIRRQAPQLGDAYLYAAMYLLNRLVLIGETEDLSEDERMARGADLVAQAWSTTQRGKAYLDEQLGADESQADADAVMESILGRAWKLTELKERGYWAANLKLLELAFERYDDHARHQRIEIGHLLDLNDGRMHQAIALRPFKGMKFIAEQPSYSQVLTISEGAIYPGYVNKRVRWEKGAETGEDVKPAHLQQAYYKSLPDFKPALETLKTQMKHPLAPREGVFLVKVANIAPFGEQLVLEDAGGLRLEATDRPRDDAPLDARRRRPSKKKKRVATEPVNVDCLQRAAGQLGGKNPAVLVRLYLLPVAARIVAEPLAMLTPDLHLRLGF
jgi:hypothetical protein